MFYYILGLCVIICLGLAYIYMKPEGTKTRGGKGGNIFMVDPEKVLKKSVKNQGIAKVDGKPTTKTNQVQQNDGVKSDQSESICTTDSGNQYAQGTKEFGKDEQPVRKEKGLRKDEDLQGFFKTEGPPSPQLPVRILAGDEKPVQKSTSLAAFLSKKDSLAIPEPARKSPSFGNELEDVVKKKDAEQKEKDTQQQSEATQEIKKSSPSPSSDKRNSRRVHEFVMTKLYLFGIFYYVVCVLADKDFYELLGVAKDADIKTIRRAFKKIAMTEHPDKNKDDPDAHSKFVRMNRAYEVLKDDELRKKYDLYGEDGLKDDHPGNQQFHSWQFFRDNFGIYDEDAEIITLSRSDFDQSVANSPDLWFVNFYSPQCSHCHELAPAWRLLARELLGVIRIGAINCGDDWMLCREQGIHGYPSLVLYPSGTRYNAARDKESMVSFILDQLHVTILKVTEKNKEALSHDWEPYNSRPWVVDFCDTSESCLSAESRRKLAAMLNDLVNVASVDCVKEEKLCDSLMRTSGVAYYPVGSIQADKGIIIESLDAREIYLGALMQLPDMTELDDRAFDELENKIKDGEEEPWLIQFVKSSEDTDAELRKLPALLKEIKVGRVNCSKAYTTCERLHMTKFPTFAVFKRNGGHEIHHGRHTAHDVAGFARDCARTNVRALGPEHFPDTVVHSGNMWFVDFFAPWCPPCMKLLPEFRKASTVFGETLNFGTVDCAAHQQLCIQMNVHSYPTTILYNQSVPHPFVGLHSMQELVDFVEDIKNPPVLSLDPTNFDELVKNKAEDELWLVDFFAPWCGPCQQLAPEWRKLAKMVREMKGVKIGSVDCAAHQQMCMANHVQSYPTIRLYTANRGGYTDYNSWFRNAASIHQWLVQYLPSSVHTLDADSFLEDVLESPGPWLVDFFTPWCGHCQIFAPRFEIVAQKMEGRLRAGKVNCDATPHICQMANIRAYPTVLFYAGTDPAEMQAMEPSAGIHIHSQDANQIITQTDQLIKRYSKKQHIKDEL